MKKIITGTLILGACSSFLAAQNNFPNVIFILADDLGYSDIEPYGQEKIKTPNLTAMTRNGMQFMQFYAGTSVSAPSRASLMTGLHTGHTRIRGNFEHIPEGQEPVGNLQTLADLFHQAGYVTGCFGKWGLGYPNSGSEATDKGFDEFYGYNCQRKAHTYYPQWLYDGKTKVLLNGKSYSQDLIHQKALDFIRKNKDRSFFGYFTYTLPHAGLEQPNDSILKMYSGKYPEPKAFKGYGDYAATPEPRAQFAGMVTRLDTYVGQIRNELEKLGIAENTLIIFTSDNGPHLEGGADPAFFACDKTLRGTKRSLYEGGMRVPMIAEWKGTIKPGTISELPAAFWDMMPTFADITGQQKSWIQTTDGISFLPVLKGTGTQTKHKYLYWEFHEENGRQALRQGDWKLIRQNIRSGNPTLELYNLKSDPFEKNNLAASKSNRVNSMKKLLDKARTHSELFNFGINEE